MNLSKHIKFVKGLDHAEGTASRNGASVDMSGWDGVLMVLTMGDLASSAAGDLHAETSSDDSNFNDLAGTKIAIADDDDNQRFILDIYKPRERYLRGVVTKDGSNNQEEILNYFLYRGRKLPVANMGADEYELHVSPAEGTK